jgi:cell division protein FtsI/penicillin-binding protein 2
MVYASAIGYFPSTAPRVAIYVVIDSPKTGVDYGGTIASPLFRKLATEIGTLLGIPSDKK